MEVEAKEGGTLEESLPVKNAIAQPLKVSNELPHPCRKCTKRESVQEDGVDAGKMFTCGVCVENMEAGIRSFYCPWFNPEPEEAFTTVEELDNGRLVCKSAGTTCQCSKQENPCGKVIAAIIDAEKANEALKIVAALKARKPSPHAFLDDAMAYRIQPKEVR